MDDPMVEHVDVWAAAIEDRPGGLANVLASLRDAGADLQFIIARRAPDEPGKGVLFVTPLQGDREIAAAAEMGFKCARRPSLRSRVDASDMRAVKHASAQSFDGEAATIGEGACAAVRPYG